MVWQVRAGYAVFGREIKVPQTFINNLMRATLFGKTQDLTDVLNTIHALTTDHPVTDTDVDAFGSAVDSWARLLYMPVVANQISYIGTHARSMEGLIVPNYTSSGAPTPGTLPGEALPTFTSMPVMLATGLTGHRSHGTWHAWYATEDVNTASGNPAASYLTNLQSAIADLLSAITGVGFTPVIASFKYGVTTPIKAVLIRNYWGSMISRKLEHGR